MVKNMCCPNSYVCTGLVSSLLTVRDVLEIVNHFAECIYSILIVYLILLLWDNKMFQMFQTYLEIVKGREIKTPQMIKGKHIETTVFS